MRRLPGLFAVLALPLALAAAGWEQVSLFDWVYPGEPGYTALQEAVRQSGKQGWLPSRMAQNDKLPQASARELAWELASDPQVDPSTQARLKELFDDEAGQLRLADQGSSRDRADSLGEALNQAGQRMDEIERIYKTNNYSKGSTPGVNMDLFAGYRGENMGGMIQRRNRAYLEGGANFILSATVGRVNATLGIGGRYQGDDTGGLPAGNAWQQDTSYLQNTVAVGASFQMPLDNGGVEVHLGDIVGVYMSPLLMGSIFQEGVEAFAVDVTTPFRPERIIKVLDLSYPAFTKDVRGVVLKRQGSVWYWPFAKTEFFYAPHNQYFQNWGANHQNKLSTYALRLDRDINPGRWTDPGLYYAMLLNSSMDQDQLRIAATPFPALKAVDAYGAGAEIRFINGSQLKLDAALSNYRQEKSVGGPQRLDSGIAYIASLAQPLGPFNLAVEAGMADPYFRSAPYVDSREQNGAVPDTMSTVTWANGDPDRVSFVSFMKDAAVMTNNSSRLGLKGEWHGGWISLGLFQGTQGQVKATDGRVVINPYIQGRSDNGYGWFRLFGQTYGLPPAPGTAGTTYTDTGLQARFNRPTDASGANQAVDPAGGSTPVHWQEISQLGYRETFFTTWLSEGGIGDRRLMKDSVKAFNYMGARLVLDVAALLGLDYPSRISVVSELRELAAQAGIPSFDASQLFSQGIVSGTWTHGLNGTLELLGLAAVETWKTRQSYYPVDMQVLEFGGGFDLKLDAVLTGLKANVRGTSMLFDDWNLPSRAFSLWTLSVGTTLTY